MNNDKFNIKINHPFLKDITVNHEFIKNDVASLINFLFINKIWINLQSSIFLVDTFLKNLDKDKEKYMQPEILDLLKNFKNYVENDNGKKNQLIKILWVINYFVDEEYKNLFLHYIKYKKMHYIEIEKIFKNHIQEFYNILERYDFPIIDKYSVYGKKILSIIHYEYLEEEIFNLLCVKSENQIQEILCSTKFNIYFKQYYV